MEEHAYPQPVRFDAVAFIQRRFDNCYPAATLTGESHDVWGVRHRLMFYVPQGTTRNSGVRCSMSDNGTSCES